MQGKNLLSYLMTEEEMLTNAYVILPEIELYFTLTKINPIAKSLLESVKIPWQSRFFLDFILKSWLLQSIYRE